MSHRLQITRKLLYSVIALLIFFSNLAFSAPGNFYLGGSPDESVAWLANRTSIISYFSGTAITDSYAITQSHHVSMLTKHRRWL